MNDLESIRGVLVSFEIEREVHVFQEKGECPNVIEELSDFIILDNLAPVLLLFAVGGLGLVGVIGKAMVFGVHASIS